MQTCYVILIKKFIIKQNLTNINNYCKYFTFKNNTTTKCFYFQILVTNRKIYINKYLYKTLREKYSLLDSVPYSSNCFAMSSEK